MIEEFWKSVLGHERYEVSNRGRVRIVASGHIMSPAKNPRGYVHLTLSHNGKKTTHDIHRLVAKAFLGEPKENQETVNHKNGDKADNRLENLEYATRSENQQHALKILGFQPRFGDNHPHVKISDKNVQCIRCLARMGMKKTSLARKFGRSAGGICDIVNGKQRVKAA